MTRTRLQRTGHPTVRATTHPPSRTKGTLGNVHRIGPLRVWAAVWLAAPGLAAASDAPSLDKVTQVAFDPEGRLVTADLHGAWLWDFSSPQLVRQVASSVRALGTGAALDHSRGLHPYNARLYHSTPVPRPSGDLLWDLALGRRGSVVVQVTRDAAHAWDAETGIWLAEVPFARTPRVAITPDGQTLIARVLCEISTWTLPGGVHGLAFDLPGCTPGDFPDAEMAASSDHLALALPGGTMTVVALDTGAEVYRGITGARPHLALSADRVAYGDEDGNATTVVRLGDGQASQVKTGPVRHLAYSPVGETLAVATTEGMALLIDEEGEVFAELAHHAESDEFQVASGDQRWTARIDPYAQTFETDLPDTARAHLAWRTVGATPTLVRWHPAEDLTPGAQDGIIAASFRSAGGLHTVGKGRVQSWSFAPGRPFTQWDLQGLFPNVLAVDSDVGLSWRGTTEVLDLETGRAMHNLGADQELAPDGADLDAARQLALLWSGDRYLTWHYGTDETPRIGRVSPDEAARAERGPPAIRTGALLPDGGFVLHRGCGVAWYTPSGKERQSWTDPTCARRPDGWGYTPGLAIAAPVGRLAVTLQDGTTHLIDPAAPNAPLRLPGLSQPVLAWTAGDDLLVASPYDPVVQVFSADGHLRTTVRLGVGVRTLVADHESERVLALTTDGTAVLLDGAQGTAVATIAVAAPDEYAVALPDGTFWASARAGDHFGHVVDGRFRAIPDAYDALHRPDRVMEALGWTDAAAVAQTARLVAVARAADVRGGPTGDRTAIGHGGRRFVVAIGVSDYADPRQRLEYADDDARAVADLLARRAGAFDSVDVQLLVDGDATRAGISGARQALATAGPQDQVVVFAAGHGVLGPDGEWYFAPADMDFDQPAERGIPYAELVALAAGGTSGSRLLLVDACNAGEQYPTAQAIGPIEGVPEGRGTVRGLAVMGSLAAAVPVEAVYTNYRAEDGVTVVVSSTGAQYAVESDKLAHGAFTWALLEGVGRSSADADGDGDVRVSELLRYVGERVPALTQGAQQPVARRVDPTSDPVVLGAREPLRKPALPPTSPPAWVSPDGREAYIDQGGQLVRWDTAAQRVVDTVIDRPSRETRRNRLDPDHFVSWVVSPNGQEILASTSLGDTLHRTVSDASPLERCRTDDRPPWGPAAFSPEDTTLVTSCPVALRDGRSGAELQERSQGLRSWLDGFFWPELVTPLSVDEVVVAGRPSLERTAALARLRWTGAAWEGTLRPLEVQTEPGDRVVLCGRTLAWTAGGDLRWFHLDGGEAPAAVAVPRVLGLRCTADGRYLTATSTAGQVLVWDLDGTELLRGRGDTGVAQVVVRETEVIAFGRDATYVWRRGPNDDAGPIGCDSPSCSPSPSAGAPNAP